MGMQVDSGETCRVALIGDIHGSWDDQDVAYFNQSDYDLLLFVGDLGGGTLRSGLQVARSVARLGRPALVIPGNNDAVHIAQLAAEFIHQQGLIKLLSIGHQRRSRALANALGEVQLCGYSLHPYAIRGVSFDVIACRPHPMGGPHLSFTPYLAQEYDIHDLDASAARLMSLVDEASNRRIVFLAHNGPSGFGSGAADIWGCDFKAEGGDWGDPDLALAIDYARKQGKEILAVLAGHMHQTTKSGAERVWQVEKDGIPYINAARVPRIYSTPEGGMRHHIAVTISADHFAFDVVEISR